MSKRKNSNAKAKKKPEAKANQHQPDNHWRAIFSGTLHDVTAKGYWPNFIVSVIFLFLSLALTMSNYKYAIYSLAVALTVLIWTVAIIAVRQVQPPVPKVEAPTPIPPPETELHGVLIPANEPSPPNVCEPLPPNAVSVFFGNVVAYTRTFPMVALRIHGIDVLTLKRTADGLALSAQVFSADGRIVAELEDNEFHVNPNNYFKVKRPDRSTLIVYDQQNNVALKVRYLNSQAIRVVGVFSTATTPRPLIIDEETVHLKMFAPGSRMCLGENKYGLIIPSGPVVTPDDLYR